jgi:hypothetical protein
MWPLNAIWTFGTARHWREIRFIERKSENYCAWNIFDDSSSSDTDVHCYVIVGKLLGSTLNIDENRNANSGDHVEHRAFPSLRDVWHALRGVLDKCRDGYCVTNCILRVNYHRMLLFKMIIIHNNRIVQLNTPLNLGIHYREMLRPYTLRMHAQIHAPANIEIWTLTKAWINISSVWLRNPPRTPPPPQPSVAYFKTHPSSPWSWCRLYEYCMAERRLCRHSSPVAWSRCIRFQPVQMGYLCALEIISYKDMLLFYNIITWGSVTIDVFWIYNRIHWPP